MQRDPGTTPDEATAALDEAALVAAVAAGDHGALAALYDSHVRAVYRFALAELRSVEEAEDLSQEVFIVLLRKAKTIQLPGVSVLPWLLVTCRNLARNRHRAIARTAAGSLDEVEFAAADNVERDYETSVLRDSITSAIDLLSDDDQVLFWMCIDGGLTYQAAARALRTTHGAVRNRLARIRKRLRIELSPEKASIGS